MLINISVIDNLIHVGGIKMLHKHTYLPLCVLTACALPGRELRSGVKCIIVTIVTGSLWLVRRYPQRQVNLKTISTIPSH